MTNSIDNNSSPIPTASTIATTAAITAVIKEEPFYNIMMHGYQQYPSVQEFSAIVNDYLQNLSSKKRDKALVDSHRYSLILQVLKDPRNTAISTAQFRFWVKKMFRLSCSDYMKFVVCHDDKPVATREDIYNILMMAHKEAHHGGRDKTSALVRKRYSWIPKELIARFVRHCPFCISRRNGCHPPPLVSSSALLNYLTSTTTNTTTKKRKSSHLWSSNYAMVANVATSAAAAAIAYNNSPKPTEDTPFDFCYQSEECGQTSPKPYSYLLFSTHNNSAPTAAAAAVVTAAAIAAVNSQLPCSPTHSSASEGDHSFHQHTTESCSITSADATPNYQ